MDNMAEHTNWVLRPLHREQARVRLFCFPYAGGGASSYRAWPRELPPQIEVCPIQLPGREARIAENPIDNLDTLAHTLTAELIPYLDLPFSFFGHSLGSLIAFEVARRLIGHGYLPVHLFVSGRRAPHLRSTRPPISNLPEEEFRKELRRMDGTPEQVLQHEELMSLLVPTLRVDFCMHETYRYVESDPLPYPITAFGGFQDKEVGQDELSAWEHHTTSTFELRMFPGGHFFVHTYLTFLLRVLAQKLIHVHADTAQFP